MDIMFYEVFKEEAVALKKFLPKNLHAGFTWKTIQEYNSAQLPASLISVRTQSRIPKEWGKKLNGILTRTTGYEHISTFRRAVKWEVPAGYLPDYCARSVAEHAVLMAWALLRKFKIQEEQFGIFKRDGITGHECRGKNLLVVGVGHIGSEVVEIAKGLKMNVQGVDIKKRIKNLKYVSLARGVQWADIIICALPLTPATRGMLNYKSLKSAKSGTLLINISRGEITPLKDLQRLLDEKILGGIGLDVYEEEELLAGYMRGNKMRPSSAVRIALELKDRENVIFTPHNAFNTHEAVERKASDSAKAITSFLKKGKFPDPVPVK